MIEKPEEIKDEEVKEKPPLLGKWKNLYWFVFSFLVFQIIIYFIFTKVFE